MHLSDGDFFLLLQVQHAPKHFTSVIVDPHTQKNISPPLSTRPILDLSLLNHSLMKRLFRVLTLKQILVQVCPEDWFLTVELKDAYFHIHITPPPQTVLEIQV